MGNKLRYACLFSGIGAPLQGAFRVYGEENIEHVFSCEYDKFARQSFNAIYDIDPLHFHKDIHDMDGTQYRGKVDILVGGSPCQAFSIAGLRNGTSDERGQLIYQYIRIVGEVKAPIIIYENVKGMLSIEGGRTIKEFVQALRNIGYYCHYEVVNTKDYGVPQNRERIFLVGFLDYKAYHSFSFAPKQKLDKRLKDILEDEVEEKYYLSAKMINYLAKKPRAIEPYNGKQEISPCILAGYYKTPTDGFYINTDPQEIAPKIGAMRGCNPQNPKSRSVGLATEQMLEINENGISNCLTTVQKDNLVIEPKIWDDQGRVKKQENPILLDYCPTLRAQSHGDEPKIIQIGSIGGAHEANSRVYSIDGVSPTLMAGNNGGGQSPVKHLTKTLRIRKLTPLECWRLQDFPDDAYNKAKDAGVSNSMLYKQIGNSMSCNVLEMIFRQIVNGKNSDSLF